jgi:hypothetical protein
MSAENRDPLFQIAEQVADCFAEFGYAFIEDDKIEGLAALLGSFLTVAGISVNPSGAGRPTLDNEAHFPISRPISTQSDVHPKEGTIRP